MSESEGIFRKAMLVGRRARGCLRDAPTCGASLPRPSA
jgi:hypothetical protein